MCVYACVNVCKHLQLFYQLKTAMGKHHGTLFKTVFRDDSGTKAIVTIAKERKKKCDVDK